MTTMITPVRVRFAPSPTGNLHIGGLRTALFNWLLARHTKGRFLLRIEDTDIERNKDEYTHSILAAFGWVSIHSDEPIVIQSSRFSQHRQVVDSLLLQGLAYRCYCTADEVAARHATLFPGDEFVKYDQFCRNRVMKQEMVNTPHVIRFAIPSDSNNIEFEDIIRGPIVVDLKQLDDFIIVRSDGVPVYNLVVVIDDAYMQITHVIRGEEHISNTPKQLLIYRACGYKIPQFAHIPLILGPSGARLSKRDGATSVLEYRDKGYLPEALINYIARLGWAYGDQEKFSLDELIAFFSLEHISRKNAIFDIEKLDWLNGVYIREYSVDMLWNYCITQLSHLPLVKKLILCEKHELVVTGIVLYKERVTTLIHLLELVDRFCFGVFEPQLSNELSLLVGDNAINYLTVVIDQLSLLPLFEAEALKRTFKDIAVILDVKLSLIAQPVRVALQGSVSGPGLFDLLVGLEKEESLKRLHRLLVILREV